MTMSAIFAIITCGVPAVRAFHLPFITSAPSTRRAGYRKALPRRGVPLKVNASPEEEDLLWPWSLPVSENVDSDEDDGDMFDEDEQLFSSALDTVVKVYATHSGKR